MSLPSPEESSRRLMWGFWCVIGTLLAISSLVVIVIGLLVRPHTGFPAYVTVVIGLVMAIVNGRKLRHDRRS